MPTPSKTRTRAQDVTLARASSLCRNEWKKQQQKTLFPGTLWEWELGIKYFPQLCQDWPRGSSSILVGEFIYLMAVVRSRVHASTVSRARTPEYYIHHLRDDLHGSLWLKSKEKHLQGKPRGKEDNSEGNDLSSNMFPNEPLKLTHLEQCWLGQALTCSVGAVFFLVFFLVSFQPDPSHNLKYLKHSHLSEPLSNLKPDTILTKSKNERCDIKHIQAKPN